MQIASNPLTGFSWIGYLNLQSETWIDPQVLKIWEGCMQPCCHTSNKSSSISRSSEVMHVICLVPIEIRRISISFWIWTQRKVFVTLWWQHGFQTSTHLEREEDLAIYYLHLTWWRSIYWTGDFIEHFNVFRILFGEITTLLSQSNGCCLLNFEHGDLEANEWRHFVRVL